MAVELRSLVAGQGATYQCCSQEGSRSRPSERSETHEVFRSQSPFSAPLASNAKPTLGRSAVRTCARQRRADVVQSPKFCSDIQNSIPGTVSQETLKTLRSVSHTTLNVQKTLYKCPPATWTGGLTRYVWCFAVVRGCIG